MSATSRMLSFARVALVLPLLASVMVFATQFASTPQAEAASAYTKKVRAAKIADAYSNARKQLGDPYRRGGDGPSSFDCSGLIQYAYGHAGFNAPRTSSQQANYARRIHRKWLRQGDLIFFHSGGRVYHVAIYAGMRDGERVILHSGRSGEDVRYARVWSNSWFAGTLRAS